MSMIVDHLSGSVAVSGEVKEEVVLSEIYYQAQEEMERSNFEPSVFRRILSCIRSVTGPVVVPATELTTPTLPTPIPLPVRQTSIPVESDGSIQFVDDNDGYFTDLEDDQEEVQPDSEQDAIIDSILLNASSIHDQAARTTAKTCSIPVEMARQATDGRRLLAAPPPEENSGHFKGRKPRVRKRDFRKQRFH